MSQIDFSRTIVSINQCPCGCNTITFTFAPHVDWEPRHLSPHGNIGLDGRYTEFMHRIVVEDIWALRYSLMGSP